MIDLPNIIQLKNALDPEVVRLIPDCPETQLADYGDYFVYKIKKPV